MKKKHGFIFLSLGIISFMMFGIYNYTDLFNKTTIDENVDYGYVKTHDVNKKTKVSFPLYQHLVSDNSSSNEYMMYYTNNDGLNLNALVYNDSLSIEEYVNNDVTNYPTVWDENEYKVVISDVKCENLCKKFQVLKDNKIYQDELRIYIKSSTIDIIVLMYQSLEKEISEDLINKIVKNIIITNDAEYQTGTSDGDKVKINLEDNNGKKANISLDASIYETNENGDNSKNVMVVKNKATGAEIYLILKYKTIGETIREDIDSYYDMNNPGSNVREIEVGAKLFYEYNVNGIMNYAYIIDDESALLIQPVKTSINIEDFVDIY